MEENLEKSGLKGTRHLSCECCLSSFRARCCSATPQTCCLESIIEPCRDRYPQGLNCIDERLTFTQNAENSRCESMVTSQEMKRTVVPQLQDMCAHKILREEPREAGCAQCQPKVLVIVPSKAIQSMLKNGVDVSEALFYLNTFAGQRSQDIHGAESTDSPVMSMDRDRLGQSAPRVVILLLGTHTSDPGEENPDHKLLTIGNERHQAVPTSDASLKPSSRLLPFQTDSVLAENSAACTECLNLKTNTDSSDEVLQVPENVFQVFTEHHDRDTFDCQRYAISISLSIIWIFFLISIFLSDDVPEEKEDHADDHVQNCPKPPPEVDEGELMPRVPLEPTDDWLTQCCSGEKHSEGEMSFVETEDKEQKDALTDMDETQVSLANIQQKRSVRFTDNKEIQVSLTDMEEETQIISQNTNNGERKLFHVKKLTVPSQFVNDHSRMAITEEETAVLMPVECRCGCFESSLEHPTIWRMKYVQHEGTDPVVGNGESVASEDQKHDKKDKSVSTENSTEFECGGFEEKISQTYRTIYNIPHHTTDDQNFLQDETAEFNGRERFAGTVQTQDADEETHNDHSVLRQKQDMAATTQDSNSKPSDSELKPYRFRAINVQKTKLEKKFHQQSQIIESVMRDITHQNLPKDTEEETKDTFLKAPPFDAQSPKETKTNESTDDSSTALSPYTNTTSHITNQFRHQVVAMLRTSHRNTHTSFHSEWNRLVTFQDLQVPEGIYVVRLANEGFFLPDPRGTEVECAFCLVRVPVLQFRGREVREVHRRVSPGCQMVTGRGGENVSIAASFSQSRERGASLAGSSSGAAASLPSVYANPFSSGYEHHRSLPSQSVSSPLSQQLPEVLETDDSQELTGTPSAVNAVAAFHSSFQNNSPFTGTSGRENSRTDAASPVAPKIPRLDLQHTDTAIPAPTSASTSLPTSSTSTSSTSSNFAAPSTLASSVVSGSDVSSAATSTSSSSATASSTSVTTSPATPGVAVTRDPNSGNGEVSTLTESPAVENLTVSSVPAVSIATEAGATASGNQDPSGTPNAGTPSEGTPNAAISDPEERRGGEGGESGGAEGREESSSTEEKQVVTYEELGIFAQRPKRPDMAVTQTRIATFTNWPHESTHPAERMAEAGFYYTGHMDLVRCFFCKGGLKTWEQSDQPWVEHCRWFPRCPFIRLAKGQRFVDVVQRLNDPATQPMICEEEVSREVMRMDEEEIRNLPPPPRAAASEEPVDPYKEVLSKAGLRADMEIVNEQSWEELTEQLEEEQESIRNVTLCKMCQSQEVNVLFLPCGHLVSCAQCAPALRTCAMCRQPVKGSVRVRMTDDVSDRHDRAPEGAEAMDTTGAI